MELEHRADHCQPKGGMCAVCVRRDEDCSGLDFEAMPIIAIELDEIIVRCVEFERHEEVRPGAEAGSA